MGQTISGDDPAFRCVEHPYTDRLDGGLDSYMEQDGHDVHPPADTMTYKAQQAFIALEAGRSEIDLRQANIGTQGLYKVATALDRHPGITKLMLRGNAIGNDGAARLARVLSHERHYGLRSLWLESNNIGDTGALCLAKTFGKTSCLQRLSLQANRVSDASATELIMSLARHASLDFLDLAANMIGDAAASRIVSALLDWSSQGREVSCDLSGNSMLRFGTGSPDDIVASMTAIRSLAARGITLRQLLELYKLGQRAGTIEPETTTTGNVVFDLVIPITQDGHRSYVDQRINGNPPTVHVIHAWGMLFRDLLRAIATDATGTLDPELDADAVVYRELPQALDRSHFLCAFCVNQHTSIDCGCCAGRFAIGDPKCEIDKFHLVIEQIARRNGHALLALNYEYTALKRVWCLREVQEAMRLQEVMPLEIGFSRLRPFPRELRGTLVQNSQASSEDDRQMILREIDQHLGGFDKFNANVIDFVESSVKSKYDALVAMLDQSRDAMHTAS